MFKSFTSILSSSVLVLALVGCGTPATAPEAQPPLNVEQPASTAPASTAPTPAQQPAARPAPAAPASQPAPAAPVRQPAPPARETQAGRMNNAAPAPPVEAPPQAEPVVMTVPAGTFVGVSFIDSVSSQESQTGDSVRVRVTQDVMQNGIPVIPAGSVVVGKVTEAVALNKKIGGKARVGLEFYQIELTSGRSAGVHAIYEEVGKSETKKDAATIGGATAGGALLGRLIKKDDKDKGALIGAVVGAAAGTAVAAKTEGEEVLIVSGTEISLRFDEPTHITVRP